MTYGELKNLVSALLIGDHNLTKEDDQVIMLLDYAFDRVANEADAISLMTTDSESNVIVRNGPGALFIRKPRLPSNDDASIDVDPELTYAVARFMASFVSREKVQLHQQEAKVIINRYNEKVQTFFENYDQYGSLEYLNEYDQFGKRRYPGSSAVGSASCDAIATYSVDNFYDVDLTGIQVGQILEWDGSSLVPVDNNDASIIETSTSDFVSTSGQTSFVSVGNVFTSANLYRGGLRISSSLYSISNNGSDTTILFTDGQTLNTWIIAEYSPVTNLESIEFTSVADQKYFTIVGEVWSSVAVYTGGIRNSATEYTLNDDGTDTLISFVDNRELNDLIIIDKK